MSAQLMGLVRELKALNARIEYEALGEFVEKEHTVARERDLARRRHAAAAD